MQIPKPSRSTSFKRGLSFCYAVQKLLEGIGNDFPSQRLNGTLKKLPEWREGKDFMCIELRSKPSRPHFSLGFNLLPQFSIFAEGDWVKRPSGTPKEILKQFCEYYDWNGGSGFGLEKRPEHPQWNSRLIEDDLRRIAIIASKLQHGESIEGVSLCAA